MSDMRGTRTWLGAHAEFHLHLNLRCSSARASPPTGILVLIVLILLILCLSHEVDSIVSSLLLQLIIKPHVPCKMHETRQPSIHPSIHPAEKEEEGLCSEIGTSASEGSLHELLYGNKVCVGVYYVCLLVYSTLLAIYGENAFYSENMYIYSPYSTPYHSELGNLGTGNLCTLALGCVRKVI